MVGCWLACLDVVVLDGNQGDDSSARALRLKYRSKAFDIGSLTMAVLHNYYDRSLTLIPQQKNPPPPV